MPEQGYPPQGHPQQPQGYPQPQGHPQQPQGYPQQPQGYAPAAFPLRPSTGVRHWALQLLSYLPIPLLPLLIVPLVLLGLRSSAVRNGGVDEANSRGALNWSFTWLASVVVTATLHFVLLFVLTSGGSVSGSSPQGIVLAITASLLGIAYIGGGIMTLVNLVRGWSAAARGEAVGPLLAIPFLRAPRTPLHG
ncbi:hypothetical protein [Agrococcus sp. Marseille-P2731]|uniref:hypothetical protein n=1 Tax=Agrococcus sp. Marseille-P2731 TaxID=1841862 RepID=UPI00093161BB|nr:hypothetical protein [Agrococcus sp. Marseille-P2731]